MGLWSPHNVKVVAYELARLRSSIVPRVDANHGSDAAPGDKLPSLVCCSVDWRSVWLPYWTHRIGMKPAFHRKLWEFAYIAQALCASGKLRADVRGLGFGCGKEPLASLFVHLGCEVVATDLEAADARAGAWSGSDQHAHALASVWMPELCTKEEAEARLRFRPVDMNSIPADLLDSFDFCWSSCAFEHLGSIEQGLAFVRSAARCLRSGGVAVHTTELNPDPGSTLEHRDTVLFQMKHLESLSAQLAAEGVDMSPVLLREGDPFLDGYIDTPPYPNPSSVGATLAVLHLRLLVGSYRTTSVGIVMHKR